MADDTGQAGAARATSAAEERRQIAEQSRQREPRFTVEDLRTRPDVLSEAGFSATEVAVGLAKEDDPDRQMTRAEAVRLVEAALARPVEHDDVPAPDDAPEEG